MSAQLHQDLFCPFTEQLDTVEIIRALLFKTNDVASQN